MIAFALIVKSAALGAAVGLISSILGLGGGVLIVPLLPLITPLTQREAIGTSLFCIFFVVAMNTLSFHRKGLINWKVISYLGPLTATLTFLAAKITFLMTNAQLKMLLAVVLLFFAVQLILSSRNPQKPTDISKQKKQVIFALGGSLSGVLSGLCGVGAGLILNPLMIQYRLVSPDRVAPMANGVMFWTTLFGAIGFLGPLEITSEGYRLGVIHLDKAFVIVAGAWLFSYVGRRWQSTLPMQYRRWIFSFLLLSLGIQTLLRVF